MQIRLRDFTMEYEERGSGLPLILIHGYPLNRKIWKPQLESLSASARVIAPDLRGHGGSEPTPGTYTMDVLAKDIKELIDNLEIERPVIGGLSMGGYVAFAFVREYPEQVRGMILAATRSAADSLEVKVSREEAAAVALERGSEAIMESLLPKMMSPKSYENNPDLVEKVRQIMVSTPVQTITSDLRGMINRPDSTSTLEEIHQPVLILHGEDDQLIPRQEAEAMHQVARESSLQFISNAGHLISLEQPERFNEAVRDFIKLL